MKHQKQNQIKTTGPLRISDKESNNRWWQNNNIERLFAQSAPETYKARGGSSGSLDSAQKESAVVPLSEFRIFVAKHFCEKYAPVNASSGRGAEQTEPPAKRTDRRLTK